MTSLLAVAGIFGGVITDVMTYLAGARPTGAAQQADEELVHHPPSLRALHHPQREEDFRYNPRSQHAPVDSQRQA